MKLQFGKSAHQGQEDYIRIPFEGRTYEIYLPVSGEGKNIFVEVGAVLAIADLLTPAIQRTNFLRDEFYRHLKLPPVFHKSAFIKNYINEHGVGGLRTFMSDTWALKQSSQQEDVVYVQCAQIRGLSHALKLLCYLKREAENNLSRHPSDKAYWHHALSGKVIALNEPVPEVRRPQQNWLQRLFA